MSPAELIYRLAGDCSTAARAHQSDDVRLWAPEETELATWAAKDRRNLLTLLRLLVRLIETNNPCTHRRASDAVEACLDWAQYFPAKS